LPGFSAFLFWIPFLKFRAPSPQYRVFSTSQGFSKNEILRARWKSPMMAWSTVCDDYFRVATSG